jgi:hypothetical protein
MLSSRERSVSHPSGRVLGDGGEMYSRRRGTFGPPSLLLRQRRPRSIFPCQEAQDSLLKRRRDRISSTIAGFGFSPASFTQQRRQFFPCWAIRWLQEL